MAHGDTSSLRKILTERMHSVRPCLDAKFFFVVLENTMVLCNSFVLENHEVFKCDKPGKFESYDMLKL